MRLIDADKLKEDVNEWLSYDYKTRVDLTAVKIPNKWLNALIKCIDNQPTVDVLDKIRAEIEQYQADCNLANSDEIDCKFCDSITFDTIYRIIDKYRNEVSE